MKIQFQNNINFFNNYQKRANISAPKKNIKPAVILGGAVGAMAILGGVSLLASKGKLGSKFEEISNSAISSAKKLFAPKPPKRVSVMIDEMEKMSQELREEIPLIESASRQHMADFKTIISGFSKSKLDKNTRLIGNTFVEFSQENIPKRAFYMIDNDILNVQAYKGFSALEDGAKDYTKGIMDVFEIKFSNGTLLTYMEDSPFERINMQNLWHVREVPQKSKKVFSHFGNLYEYFVQEESSGKCLKISPEALDKTKTAPPYTTCAFYKYDPKKLDRMYKIDDIETKNIKISYDTNGVPKISYSDVLGDAKKDTRSSI